MKMRLLKIDRLRELESNIASNLQKYRSGDFEELEDDQFCFHELENEIDESILGQIECSDGFYHGGQDENEAKNCVLLYESLNGLSLYNARDERLWVYLLHTKMLEYARKRWPMPDDNENAVKHIMTHYFIKGSRGFERDNAISRLWWMASVCSRVTEFPLEDVLTYFLEQYDVRANIIERPTTSQNINVFSVIISKLETSYKTDKKLFNREFFREFMKELNLAGGTKLLASLEINTIEQIVNDCIISADRTVTNTA